MAGVLIPAVDSHRHLGLIINEYLTWTNHIDSVYTTCAQKIGMLNRLSHSVHKDTLARIYLGFIRPRSEYACALWCGEITDKIVKLQKKFCRRHGLDIVSLNVRFSYHTLLLFYQIKSKISPTYLSSVLPRSFKETPCYNLRRTGYPVPILNRQSSFKSFYPRAVILWNSLPQYVQVSASSAIFKKRLAVHLNMYFLFY